jgi:hypothetical protein
MGPGSLALLLNAGAWALAALSMLMGGLDPGMEAVALMVLAYLCGVAALLVALLGMIQRVQMKRSVAALLLVAGWLVLLTGAFGGLRLGAPA